MKKNYNKWAALFGGWFGLHRYMAGEIGMEFFTHVHPEFSALAGLLIQ